MRERGWVREREARGGRRSCHLSLSELVLELERGEGTGLRREGISEGGKMGEALTYWPFNEFLKFKMAPLFFEFSFWPITQISFSHFNPQIFKF